MFIALSHCGHKQCFPGNVFADNKTIESYQIKENKSSLLVVSMVCYLLSWPLGWNQPYRQPEPAPAASTGTGTASSITAPPPPAVLSAFLQLAQQQEQHPPQAPPSVAVGPTSVDPRHIREVLTQNPAVLQPMIQQLTQINPHLARFDCAVALSRVIMAMPSTVWL